MKILDISIFQKKLKQINKQSLPSILKILKLNITNQLKTLPTKDNHNNQKSLKNCLLLTHFLLKEKPNFNQLLQELKSKEQKTAEKELLYFDLALLQSNLSIPANQELPNNIAYDQLLRINAKWNLLFPKLIRNKYERQLKQSAKSDFKISPTKTLALLELLIDYYYRLPAKANFIKAVEHKLSQYTQRITHFWDKRTVNLNSINKKLTPVKVAIWDTGVDRNSLKNNSSDLSLSYDKNCQLTQAPLMPLDNIGAQDWQLYKGFFDLRAGKKSDAANFFLKEVAKYEEEDMARFRSSISQINLYSHGTSVANVAAQGNPFIEIVPIRITFDSNQFFPSLYTAQWIDNALKMHQAVFNWLQKNNIPIINLSWNHREQDIETSLMNTGITDPQERTTLAKKLFGDLKKNLYEGIKSCSSTLFVVGAGNSNSVVEEEDFVPSNFQLPNLISVGAVNHQGKRTGFTSIGKNVQLYANGSYVDTVIPNGIAIQSSGTSIAAPQVCNLAGTMLSICPTLSILELKKYLLKYADSMPEEDILVLNPKKTIEQIVLLKGV